MLHRFGSFWRLMAGARWRYAAAIVALVIASCFLYLAPLIPHVVIDGVLMPRSTETPVTVDHAIALVGGREFIADHLWLAALLVAALTALAGVFTYLRGRWSAQASEFIVRRLRDRLYDHLQRLPCRYFDHVESGDLIQRCTSDVETLRVFLSNHVVEIGRALIMLIVPIPLMLAIDVRMTLISLVLMPIIGGFSFYFFLRVKTAFQEADEAEGRMTATLQENLSGIRVVRAFARQAFEQDRFENVAGRYRALDARLYRILAWYWSSSDLLCFMQKALVVGAGMYWLATGTLQVGAFYFFITAVTMFMWPIRMMGRILADLGKAVVAMGRIEAVLDAPEESTPSVPASIEPLTGAIAFERVSFSHGEESPVLREVSFNVPAGSSLAILGPSGCGKSTIVNLLLRLYDYDTGSIRLDGFELRELDRAFVRTQMSVVMQEPFLYSKSLRENLRIARPSASDEEIIEAASLASIHESITEFADGYDTVVGERGATLSGGQRQRVAIARALLQRPAVLILDDALSAVDAETEMMILDALRERAGRQTTIVIAHRLSTVMHADRVIVMERGRIVQSGTHAELVHRPGLYQRLWAIQNAVEPGESTDPAGSRQRLETTDRSR